MLAAPILAPVPPVASLAQPGQQRYSAQHSLVIRLGSQKESLKGIPTDPTSSGDNFDRWSIWDDRMSKPPGALGIRTSQNDRQSKLSPESAGPVGIPVSFFVGNPAQATWLLLLISTFVVIIDLDFFPVMVYCALLWLLLIVARQTDSQAGTQTDTDILSDRQVATMMDGDGSVLPNVVLFWLLGS